MPALRELAANYHPTLVEDGFRWLDDGGACALKVAQVVPTVRTRPEDDLQWSIDDGEVRTPKLAQAVPVPNCCLRAALSPK
eukprot:COSAG02_NODE_406_length_22916_cov_35.137529_4_plen_81_part_00